MRTEMSMDQFLGEVSRQNEAKKDFLVGPRKMMMVGDDALSIEGKGDYPLNAVAHSHLAEKTGIPKRYYDDVSKVPGLRSYNVNALLGASDSRNLVRTLDGHARAILSDRFKPIDNFMVLQSALPVLREHKDIEISSSQLSDRRMYLQVSFPRLTGEVAVGDAVRAGVTITNSEVGAGSFDVRSWLMRLKCANGMVGESLLRQYHVGRKVGENIEDYNIFSDDTIRAEMVSFGLRFRDILKASLTDAAFEETLARLRLTAGQHVAGKDVEGVVENIVNKYAFTKEEGKSILSNLWGDKDLSRWGIANAVTALVHESNDADRQYDFERFGSELVTMSQGEWNQIAVA
jgi:hypothetical protein